MMVPAIPLCREFLPEKIEFNGERQYCSFFVLKSFVGENVAREGKVVLRTLLPLSATER